MDADEEGEGLEEGLRRQEQASQTTAELARSDLDEVHGQSLPVGVNIDEEEMPPLEEVEEGEEEDFEDDPELIPADDEETQVPPVSRKHKETIDYNDNITRWRSRDVSADDILFQLYLRGITLEKEQEEEISKLRNKGKGRTLTKKDYVLNFIEKLMMTGQWANEVNDQLLRSRMEELVSSKEASSSTPLKDIAVAGAKAGVETLAKAGAEALAKSFLPA